MEFVAALHHWAPETRLYRDPISGRHVAIQVQPIGPVVPSIMTLLGRIPVDSDHIVPHRTKVFLCSAEGVAIDADGDPTNGLTPLLILDVGTTFDEACAAAEPLLAQGES